VELFGELLGRLGVRQGGHRGRFGLDSDDASLFKLNKALYVCKLGVKKSRRRPSGSTSTASTLSPRRPRPSVAHQTAFSCALAARPTSTSRNMFGAFRPTAPTNVGLLWSVKSPFEPLLARRLAVPPPELLITSPLLLTQMCSPCRKMPWRMSKTRKMRQRLRLKAVDDVISTLRATGVQTQSLVRLRATQQLGTSSLTCTSTTECGPRPASRDRNARKGQVHHLFPNRRWVPQGHAQDAALYKDHFAHQSEGILGEFIDSRHGTFVVIYACLRLFHDDRGEARTDGVHALAASEDYKLHLALPQPVHDRLRTEELEQVRSRFEQVDEGPLFRIEV
jgi:hypothetical protein